MRALVLALCAASCGGQSGTIKVALATAPGSQVMDAVETLRLTLTNPPQVTESTRSGGGFDLAIELDAKAVAGALIVEGFDASGALVACGQSPPFPISAINSQLVIYMAAPLSIGAAPAALDAARSEIAASLVSFGALVAGGRDAAGTVSDVLAVYNAYDHTLTPTMPMPEARTGLAMATGTNNGVYLFGGTDPSGKTVGTLWRFELPSSVAPMGGFTVYSDDAGNARAAVPMLPIGVETFVIGGFPPLELQRGIVIARDEQVQLSASAAVDTMTDTPTAIFEGDAMIRYRNDAFDTLPGPGRNATGVIALGDARFLIVGGSPPTRDALIVDGAAGTAMIRTDFLATARAAPSIATTGRHIVVAGGVDAAQAPIASAEIFDARTLAPVATVPIAPRSGMRALALPTDQVLLIGGSPATTLLELFTPDPPPH